MTDENDKTNDGQQTPAGTPSQTGPRAPLSLKPRQAGSVSTGTVRQSFSHGRTKTVVVETKRRVGAGPGHQRPQGFDVARPKPEAPAAPRPAATSRDAGGLSASEQEARRRAIELATRQQAERARAAAEERARKDAAAREQAAAADQAASAAQAEAAAARAAAEAARAEAAKLTAAAPAKAPAKPAAPVAKTPEPTPEPTPAPTPAPVEAAAPTPAAPARPAPPARPVVNFGQRTPKPQAPGRAAAERPAFGGRSAREAAMGGGERNYAERPQAAPGRPQG